MDAMLIVDMQVGLLNGEPKHDLRGVIDRINDSPQGYENRLASSSLFSTVAATATISNRKRRAGRCFPN
jgi:hypothetical protein